MSPPPPPPPLHQYIIFKITDDKKFIEIETKGTGDFEEFKTKLPDNDCRYGVLDVEISTKSGATTSKLIFIAWCAAALASAWQPSPGPVASELTLRSTCMFVPSATPTPDSVAHRAVHALRRRVSRLGRGDARSPVLVPNSTCLPDAHDARVLRPGV